MLQTSRTTVKRAAQIRDGVLAELAAEREQATADQRRARDRLATLTAQRKAVLQAYYANALPLDLLKEEMDRLTQEIAEAERLARDAGKTVEQLEITLRQALTVASTCHQHYQGAPPHVRRQINQGFFTKLFIHQDGSVERAELTEPFATLLADTSHEAMGGAQGAPEAPGTVPAANPPVSAPREARGDQSANGRRPTNVLVRTSGSDQDTRGDLVTAGSKETVLVPPAVS